MKRLVNNNVTDAINTNLRAYFLHAQICYRKWPLRMFDTVLNVIAYSLYVGQATSVNCLHL